MCGDRLAVGILIVVGLLLTTAMPAAAELEGWQYQREITIRENSGGTLRDYQVLVGLDGADFPGEAKSDGADIRFTDADGTELSYWIEEFNAGSERVRIWVKVPVIPANGDAMILMWYGNPSAESVSDGDATFEFFDDFDGSSLNGDKWDLNVGENEGRVELSGGICKLMSPNPAPSSCKITSKKLVNINNIFVVKRMKVTTGMDSRGPMQRQGFAGRRDVTTGDVKNVIDHGTEFKTETWVRWAIARDGDSYAPYKDWADVGISEGTWYTSGVAWYEKDGLRHVAWFKNNMEVSSMKYSSNDYIPSSEMYLYLCSSPYGVGSDNTGYMAVDHVFVRRYASSEPTTTFGDIEPNMYKSESNSLLDYTLSGGSSPETYLVVDDDLEVKVNGETVFVDDDGYSTHDGRGRWKGAPITFLALPGDELEIIATNSGGGEIELSALYLHADGESVHLSDGVPNAPGGDTHEFFRERFTITIPVPPSSVRIIGLPSTVHGGEDVEVTVGWENIPPNWKLVVSLEKSEINKDRLADDKNRTISGTGEAVFKLNAYQIDETYDQAKVWAGLRDEDDNWASVTTETSITVLPAHKPDDGTTEMLKLAGGAIIALLAIVLLAGKLRGKRRDATFEPPATRETKTTPLPTPTVVDDPAPQSPPPKPTPQPAPPDPTPPPEPEPTPTRESAAIEVRRGYEVLPNNDIRFGIRVINPTPYLIADVETILSYDKTLLSLKGDKVQTLANIHPNGERTAKYVLTSRGCVHNEKIDATAIYRDHTGKRCTVQMRPKEVHCVCPFLKENPMRESEFAELAAKSEHIEEGLSFSGIDRGEIAAFIKESCRHRLHTVGEREIGNTIILNLAGESIGEKAYYLLTAVIQPYKEKDVTRIAFSAYSDKPHGLHGFLNEITASIRHLVRSVQSAKEIGIIEHKQVIKIINPGTGDIIMGGKQVAGGDIVGGTKITGDVVATGGRIGGADNIIPNEGMVQHSEIGSRQRCPNCGNETQTNEKFCPNCGASIEQGE